MQGVVMNVTGTDWDELEAHVRLQLLVKDSDGGERQETVLLHPPVAAMLLCELSDLLTGTEPEAPTWQ